MRKNVLKLVVLTVIFTVMSLACEDEKPASQVVEEITISPEQLTLKVGENSMLNLHVIPANARVIWSSSNSSIAAVNSDGKVFGGAITGTAVITAQAGDKKATCLVTVSEEEEESYPIGYVVKVNIGVHTVTTYFSGKDPEPKEESTVQISGTIVGTAVYDRIEKIVSDPDYWVGLAQHGTVPVFTGSSDYKLRDQNDYSNIIFQTRGPLQVNVNRTEMNYVTIEENENPVEKYVKVYDFLSQGKNDMQSISLTIVPYFPSNLVPPLFPQYVVDLEILTYIEYISNKIVGNGHSLKWDYFTEQLEPTGDDLYMGITGSLTETDPEVGEEPVLISRETLNDYFLNRSGGSLTLNLSGSSEEDFSTSKRQRTIRINLEFSSIPNILAIPGIDMPSPPLEDWDWE